MALSAEGNLNHVGWPIEQNCKLIDDVTAEYGFIPVGHADSLGVKGLGIVAHLAHVDFAEWFFPNLADPHDLVGVLLANPPI